MATVTVAPKAMNWAADPIWMEVSTALVAGGEATEPNLSLYMLVEKDGAFFTEFNAPFDLNTGKTDFDLSGLSMTEPEAPAAGSMNSFSQGILNKPTASMVCKINEMYGQPAAKPETLASHGPYIKIHGHTPYWYGVGPTAKSTLLHSYYTTRGKSAIKELRKAQPEYVYMYSHDGGSVAINVELVYTDGTSTNVSKGSVTCQAGKISWVNVGWDVLNMDASVTSGKTVNEYIVKFTIGGSQQPIIYTIDDKPTIYDEYIMYENGIGGCEVVRCSGRHRIGAEATKSYVQMSRVRERGYSEGFRHAYNSQAAEVWQMQTGYQNKEYIRHLGQIIVAERVWYIDLLREQFTSVVVQDTSVRLIDYENDLYNLGFDIAFDNKPSISTFNI